MSHYSVFLICEVCSDTHRLNGTIQLLGGPAEITPAHTAFKGEPLFPDLKCLLDGFIFCAMTHCARNQPKSTLVLITSFGSDDVRSQADHLGALYYEKPITLEEMRAGIETQIHIHNTE